jgi:hypothetical protein
LSLATSLLHSRQKESQDGADYRNPSNNHLQRKQYQGAYDGFCFPKMGSSDNATMKDFAGVHYGKTEGNVLIRLCGGVWCLASKIGIGLSMKQFSVRPVNGEQRTPNLVSLSCLL